MQTLIVNIPDKETIFFIRLMKKFKFNTSILTEEDFEDKDKMAQWIDEGMKSEEVSKEVVYETLRKHGVKI